VTSQQVEVKEEEEFLVVEVVVMIEVEEGMEDKGNIMSKVTQRMTFNVINARIQTYES